MNISYLEGIMMVGTMEDALKIGHVQFSDSEQVRERKGNGGKEVLLGWELHLHNDY